MAEKKETNVAITQAQLYIAGTYMEDPEEIARWVELSRQATIVMLGRALEQTDDPVVFAELVAMLSFEEAPDEEPQRPQGEDKRKRISFTKSQHDAIMAKVAPDAVLAKRFGRSVSAIINHRSNTLRRKPESGKRVYEPEETSSKKVL